MRIFTKTASSLFFLLSICSGIFAQQTVSFTNQAALLNAVVGSSYEDCAVDMNGDNLDDVVRVTNNHLYIDLQQPDGSFIQEDHNINFSNYPSWSICAGDIDGNGYNDLCFGSGNRVSFIYANSDRSSYVEDMHNEYIFAQRSTFADIDNDGHLDAFVCHDVDQSHPYRNDGNGTLTLDQTLIETVDMAGNYAALWVDFDNDWDTDLFVTKCRQGSSSGDPERTNRLYQNNGDGTYSEVGSTYNMNDNAQSWATVFEDFDNDGDFDAFIVNHDFQNRFLVNDGTGMYTDIIGTTGINPNDLGAWENASGDFNNDGFVDIFSEMSRELYLNNGDLTFTGTDLPFDDGGIGDFNNDGFLDVIDGGNLWLNNTNDNNWVKIIPQGIQSNKNGIGARVEIYGSWGIQIREVRAGQSFAVMSSLTTHFGLGTAEAIDQIVIKWPSGMITVIDDPEINTTHFVPEASCLLDQTQLMVNGEAVICEGETTEIVAPDGFESYSWSNGMNSPSIVVSEAGNYTVILTDTNGCVSLSYPVIISIIEENLPVVSIDGPEIFCEGGSVVLTSSEAQDYTWSNGMTSQSISVSESGSYFVLVHSICSGQPLASEAVEVDVLASPAPQAEDVTITSPGEATLMATGQNLEWYDLPEDGILLGTGETFVTPFLNGDATFYVEAHNEHPGDLQNGGKLNNAGGGGLPSTGAYSYFDVWETFNLLSVRVYVPGNAPEGDRTIQLVDESDSVLEELVVNLTTGEHVIDLDWVVPVGNDLTLRCLENNLFRNNTGVSYPYAIGDVGEITNSFFGTSYYYYFYDWKIQKTNQECVSERTSVDVFLVTGLEDLESISGLNVFPNPATNRLNISFVATNTDPVNIRLLDILGREMAEKYIDNVQTGENLQTLNINSLAPGIYTMEFSVDGKRAAQKVLIQ